jgi:hypothetical protein
MGINISKMPLLWGGIFVIRLFEISGPLFEQL